MVHKEETEKPGKGNLGSWENQLSRDKPGKLGKPAVPKEETDKPIEQPKHHIEAVQEKAEPVGIEPTKSSELASVTETPVLDETQSNLDAEAKPDGIEPTKPPEMAPLTEKPLDETQSSLEAEAKPDGIEPAKSPEMASLTETPILDETQSSLEVEKSDDTNEENRESSGSQMGPQVCWACKMNKETINAGKVSSVA